jgi:acetyl esterase/lipase
MQFGGVETRVERIDERSIPGVAGALAVRVYTPLGAPSATLPGMLYLHGGGLVAGSIATHDGIARALADCGACRVVSLEYRLAPEHPFPAALQDARAALDHLDAEAAHYGIDRRRLGICGDSAGGTLAAATCAAIARSGGPALCLQLLLCPILDYEGGSESRRAYSQGYLVDEATLAHDLRYYLPAGMDPKDARISPLRGDRLDGLPHTLVHTAEYDPLRDEGRAYFERLQAAGSSAAYHCHPGMIHLFYGLGRVIPYAQRAFAQIGAGIRESFA